MFMNFHKWWPAIDKASVNLLTLLHKEELGLCYYPNQMF